MGKLTKRAIDAFKYEGGWDVRWDDQMPGLGVRIYESGKKSFVLSYRANGRKRLMVLGRYAADLTLDQARKRAESMRVKVNEGGDPLEEKRKAAVGQTFHDLVAAYIEKHAKLHKKTWEADKRRLDRNIPASWTNRKVNSIKRSDIAELHSAIGATRPHEANRLLEVLHKAFRLARVWGYVDEGSENPASEIDRFREPKRKRWLRPTELPNLAASIDEEPNIYIRAFLWLLMLSGARKTELLRARWDQLDYDSGILNLPETKAGEAQSLTLSQPALAILKAIPRQEGNPHIFCGQRAGKSLANMDKNWHVIRERAGVEDLRIHDLRRSVGSWLTQAGVDLNQIKEALRHSAISTTLTYARLAEDSARGPMEQHGRRVLEIAGREGPLLVAGGSDAEKWTSTRRG